MTPDPQQTQSLDDLLRRCVGCGLCLPHCATWAETGNETHSPRGRLLLLEDLLAQPNEETQAAYAKAFDLCIGCRACETACPGGVPYSLLEYGQNLLAPYNDRPSPAMAFINRNLDSQVFLNLLRTSGRILRTMLKWGWGSTWRQRLDDSPLATDRMVRLLGSMPVSPHSDENLIKQLDRLSGVRSTLNTPSVAPGPHRDVAFFISCANLGLLPASSRRLVAILEATGHRLLPLENQECCGALAAHTGRPGTAARLQRTNRQSVAALGNDEIPVVVEAAGCGHQLKNYGPEFQDRIVDAAVLLGDLVLPAMREVPLKVVYHDPCHAIHGQGIYQEPRNILKQIPGLILVEPAEAEMCCGSGGAWGLQHQEMSQRLGRRKARNLKLSGANLVVTSNPGCLGQIADGLALEAPHLPILPLSDLLWYAMATRVSP